MYNHMLISLFIAVILLLSGSEQKMWRNQVQQPFGSAGGSTGSPCRIIRTFELGCFGVILLLFSSCQTCRS